MSADLIRWTDNGYGGFLGYVGALDDWLYQIWKPDDNGGEWVLQASAMGGRPGRPSFGGNPDELRPRAEELLREFAASIGAVFPEPQPGPGGYVTVYAGRRSCRYCLLRAKWDIGGFLSCCILTHVDKALGDLTAPRAELTGDDL